LILWHSYHLFIIGFTDEAFAAKHMPDLGQDVKEFRVFSWKLTGWKKLEKKLTSPEFDCGGHRWWAPASSFFVYSIFTFGAAKANITLSFW
jgi:hypothetical protein